MNPSDLILELANIPHDAEIEIWNGELWYKLSLTCYVKSRTWQDSKVKLSHAPGAYQPCASGG